MIEPSHGNQSIPTSFPFPFKLCTFVDAFIHALKCNAMSIRYNYLSSKHAKNSYNTFAHTNTFAFDVEFIILEKKKLNVHIMLCDCIKIIKTESIDHIVIEY